jgi:hypothetical protein
MIAFANNFALDMTQATERRKGLARCHELPRGLLPEIAPVFAAAIRETARRFGANTNAATSKVGSINPQQLETDGCTFRPRGA